MSKDYRYTIDGEKLTLSEIIARCPAVDPKVTQKRVERYGWRTMAALQAKPVRVVGNATRRMTAAVRKLETGGHDMPARLRVYISGPMTGYPNLNRPAFAMAAERVEAAGMIPVNPHDLCEPNWDWHQCMRADVSALCGCDAILMIDGWHCSNGAQLELHIAHRIGLRVLLNWHDVIDFAGRK